MADELESAELVCKWWEACLRASKILKTWLLVSSLAASPSMGAAAAAAASASGERNRG